MAVNAYLVIDGIPGPSTSRKDAIDVLSFSFGASLPAIFGYDSSGKESKAGRPNISELSIMKVVDKTTPNLFQYLVAATHIAKATLYYDKPVSGKQEDYFKIEMENVLITSTQSSGSSENPTESLALAFGSVKVCYNPEDGKGGLSGWVEKTYSLETLATA
ncbi:MAG TPA: type VI secretion system tube protein Hcp [Bryobacteraceae bacterium]|jgi:type VI secretion system secreted protein Hcp